MILFIIYTVNGMGSMNYHFLINDIFWAKIVTFSYLKLSLSIFLTWIWIRVWIRTPRCRFWCIFLLMFFHKCIITIRVKKWPPWDNFWPTIHSTWDSLGHFHSWSNTTTDSCHFFLMIFDDFLAIYKGRGFSRLSTLKMLPFVIWIYRKLLKLWSIFWSFKVAHLKWSKDWVKENLH